MRVEGRGKWLDWKFVLHIQKINVLYVLKFISNLNCHLEAVFIMLTILAGTFYFFKKKETRLKQRIVN